MRPRPVLAQTHFLACRSPLPLQQHLSLLFEGFQLMQILVRLDLFFGR